MSVKKHVEPILLDVPPSTPSRAQTFQRFEHPIWTENKAQLIQKYLFYFVWVTRHGTYIDLFAGPQKIGKPGLWAAELVITSQPPRLRNFFLFEEDAEKLEMLEALKARALSEPSRSQRKIVIYRGDCNRSITRMLRDHSIRDTEATFCLLDQRTFECDWKTVVQVATHKRGGYKIELFYFLANAWIDRAESRRNDDRIQQWWGRDDWREFFRLPNVERPLVLMERLRSEFGYRYVYPFPIYARHDGGRTMYWMLHATDHPAAPRLMHQAYRNALNVDESATQLDLIAREVEKAVGGNS